MKSLFPGVNPKIELRLLKVENETIVEFVNSHSTPKQDTDLLRKFLRLCIESQLKEKTIERAEERFRKKYEFINEDTLAMAAQELPELVEALVVDDKLTPLARANALLALSYTHNEDYLSLIKAFISYESPLMRESAFMGLFEYYDRDDEEHLELKDLFKKMLETEKAPGVKQRIALLLEDM